MRVEMLRGTVYKGDTLEAGRVVDVDESFGEWMVARGKARRHVEPPAPALNAESVSVLVKTRRGRGPAEN